MKCPICRKQVALGDPFMPFCGERCKLLDLGNWASEKYVISTPVEPEVDSEESSREGS
ncbi:MAG: DNA gyrase inhibitor YacG [bacterium]|nr:DNA gyrase inhibitor YacG [bacterium]